MTKKYLAWISFSLLIASIICVGSYAYAEPQFNQAITATKTKQTEIAQLSTNVASTAEMSASETFASLPTSTPTSTETFTPTSTITLTIPATETSTPALSSCKINLANANIYALPSTGSEIIKISTSDEILLLASVEKLNWSQISINGKRYWVETQDITDSCETITLPLPYLMNWNDMGDVIFYDNNSLGYTWIDNHKSNITPLLTSGSNPKNAYYLPLDATKITKATIKDQPFGYIENFTLVTSYFWKRSDGEVGIRFWDNGSNYYEVRINNQCTINLYDTGQNIFSRDTGETNCFYDHANILQFSMQSSGDTATITIILNGKNEIIAILPNLYVGDQISWNLYGASFDVDYFTIIGQ